MNFEKIKEECQRGNNSYLIGIKVVTTENVETVMFSIKKDVMIYDVCRFIIRGNNKIEIGLINNATLAIYYFTDEIKFKEVVSKLKEFCREKPIGITYL